MDGIFQIIVNEKSFAVERIDLQSFLISNENGRYEIKQQDDGWICYSYRYGSFEINLDEVGQAVEKYLVDNT